MWFFTKTSFILIVYKLNYFVIFNGYFVASIFLIYTWSENKVAIESNIRLHPTATWFICSNWISW